jgi:hypothetical protein
LRISSSHLQSESGIPEALHITFERRGTPLGLASRPLPDEECLEFMLRYGAVATPAQVVI